MLSYFENKYTLSSLQNMSILEICSNKNIIKTQHWSYIWIWWLTSVSNKFNSDYLNLYLKMLLKQLFHYLSVDSNNTIINQFISSASFYI